MRRTLLLLLAALFVPLGAASAQTTRNMQVKAHFDDYPIPGGWGYSACWSYIHSDGREYAVIGTNGGTAFYNVTNPDNAYFVGFIPGRTSTWREMKQYRDWMYVVTEASPGATGPAAGVQIIRMTNPESPVLVATYATNFQTSHTVAVDTTRAILICNGTRAWSGGSGFARGMRFLSLANPEAPVEIGTWPTSGPVTVERVNYSHDSVPIGNRLYSSSIYDGIQRILDFTNPASTTLIKEWSYVGAFCHNSWPDATGNVLYITDEVNGQPLKIFDISNLNSVRLANTITSNPQAIVHNAHVRGTELYLSNYTEGIRVLDISDPIHPAEFAWADSYAGPSGGYNGVWEVCPFFPSGTVIASDMNTGLYVYRPARNYGLVRVQVRNQGALVRALTGVTVYLSQGDSLQTLTDGVVHFAPNPGTYTVWARKFGYVTPAQTVGVSAGDRDTVVIEIPTTVVSGTVRDALTNAGLEEAEVHLEGATGGTTDAAGEFSIPDIPFGTYEIEVHAPGHIRKSFEAELDSDPAADILLQRAPFWDKLEASSGWTVGAAGDGATSGIWTRVDPIGTSSSTLPAGELRSGSLEDAARSSIVTGDALAPSGRRRPPLDPEHEDIGEVVHEWGPVQPETDRTPGSGTMCFVTGQGTGPGQDPGLYDVDGGRTSLTTPAYDMTGLAQPTIGYWRWFYGSTSYGSLVVQISNNNGASWMPVDTTTGIHNSWVEESIAVSDYVPPTSLVRVRFVAADLDPGTSTIVEAAIDDLILYDAATPQVGAPGRDTPARLAFRTPWPNPARGTVALSLELPRSGDVEVDVLDVGGRHVRTLHRGPAAEGVLSLSWNGADDAGRVTSAGLYFVRAKVGDQVTRTRIARMR
jgi:choice-of-anchor B domain-containing protein